MWGCGGDEDRGESERRKVCVTPPGFRLQVGTGLSSLAFAHAAVSATTGDALLRSRSMNGSKSIRCVLAAAIKALRCIPTNFVRQNGVLR